MRSRDWLLAVVAALGVTALYPMQDTLSAQSGTGVVISEFRFRGPQGANDEFIELFNAGNTPVNIGGWMVRSSNNVQPPGLFTRATIPANTVINPGCYYLVANSLSSGFSGGVTPNATFTTGFADDGGVALTTSSATVIVDQVGHGTVPAAYGEGQRLAPLTTNVNRSMERRPGGTLGHVDTNNNFADFGELNPANPQNSSTCLATVYLPHQIQGAGAVSPIAPGTAVTVRGVVTARTSSGFFIQTEAGDEDADDATSEGLFVSAAGSMLASALVGRVVQAAGPVSEAGSVTHLSGATSVTDVGGASVPSPVELTSTQLSDSGSLDQLERFEGMRVSATSLTAVSSTEAGAFYAVLSGQGRTFREPGVAAGVPVPMCAIGPCNIPLFDGNPERLRVDSDGLEGVAAVSLSTGATVANVTGPLDFAHGIYTVLPESVLSPAGGTAASVASAPNANEFTVASFALGTTFPAQTAKASLLVRNTLGMPDVVAVQDAPDTAAIVALAAAIDADASAAGQAPPQYAAESGFLLKQAGGRVSMLSVEHIGGDPQAPVVLRALVSAPAQLPQAITVIASHLPPFNADPASLAARQAQAESLASYIQFRQSNDPAEAIVSVGNYNAHRFNDGYADIVGTVLGTPASPDQVAVEAHDLVSPDLVSAGDSLDPSHRYTAVVSGNAQVFDHVVLTANFAAQFAGLAYPRVNADFADTLRDDNTVANRLSDRDPVIAYFTFPPDVDAPVFETAADHIVEATGADGAVVDFSAPAATDNLDASVTITCSPSTGSTFALGNTGVTCSTQDVAGNQASTSFTVTVQDTTAPVLLLPANINDVSTDAGKAVSFAPTAIDAVTPSPAVNCAPASGSTFPVGTTTVACSTSDAAGNTATGSFTVTLTSTVFGRMAGFGLVKNSPKQTWFAFDVKESPTFGERGWVLLHIKEGFIRERYFSFAVTDVRFSSAADTVTFSGVGYWNGRSGYRYEITAADRGEPGRLRDAFTLKVTAPDGRVVETAGGSLHDGNIESFR
jgi:hypothetical protein